MGNNSRFQSKKNRNFGTNYGSGAGEQGKKETKGSAIVEFSNF